MHTDRGHLAAKALDVVFQKLHLRRMQQFWICLHLQTQI